MHVRHLRTGSWLLALAVTLAVGTAPLGARQRPAYELGSLRVAPGTVEHGVLDVAAGDDALSGMPVTVVHGAQRGPVLALIAGVHGAEITPILALQAWPPRLDPRTLRGTIVIVHVANMASFLARSVHVNPVDRKNLNRVFPGRADGSLTERIAHVLSTQVIAHADVVVDVHSGDAHEDLRPWTGFYARLGTPEVIAKSRELAVAFGVPYVVEFPFAPTPDEPARYTGVVAVRRGIPAFDVEVGRLGNVEPDLVETICTGLDRLTRHLGMRDGDVPPVEGMQFVRERTTVAAAATGIFHASVRAGDNVTAGTVIGTVTDFHGRERQRVVAPRAGHLLHVLATPAVSKDETIATIATDVVAVR